MRTVKIADMTLREGAHMSFREKIEAARLLDGVNVDVIELAPIMDERADSLLVHTIAPLVANAALSCPAGLTKEEADAAAHALSGARKPRLHILMPASAAQMEYVLHKKPDAALALLWETTAYARSLCEDVEVTLLDASRAESAFLFSLAKAAASAGAGTVTLCDGAGLWLPSEVEHIARTFAELPACLGLECGNALSMATACACAGIAGGASLVKCTAGNGTRPSVEAISRVLMSRGDLLGAQCALNAQGLSRAASQIVAMTGVKRGAAAPVQAEAPERATPLAGDASIRDVSARARQLGYDLSPEDTANVYAAFTQTARQKRVGTRDLEAIIASVALQAPPTYRLLRYSVHSGNTIAATAHIELEKNGKTLTGLSAGDGPIDAAFNALENILGHHYELDDFQIQSVTRGREALGDALVKLRDGGRLYSGKGASTDIIGASVLAYISAVNKIVHDGQQRSDRD